MIYFLVTTCVFDDCTIRKNQYINCISKLKQVIRDMNIENYKIIIIENNGLRSTFLNYMDCEVYYTNNNFLKVKNKGYKELKDILDCIEHYNINDTDFVVKITGRYVLKDNSEFMNVIKNIHITKYDSVIKYGAFYKPVNYKMKDCITGLIGMTCSYIKHIKKPIGDDYPVEWNWAEVTYLMDDNKICIVNNLDIDVCPCSVATYFAV